MRVFIAVDVPEGIRRRAEGLGAEIRGDGIIMVRAENMHLTLKFVGEADENGLAEIRERLRSVRFRRFQCDIRGVGVFPKPDFVRVVWAGAESGGALESLAGSVASTLKGFGRDEGEFTAHLTIARVKRKADFRPFLERHKDEQLGSFEVAGFHLIESAIGGSGPRYTVIESYKAEDADA